MTERQAQRAGRLAVKIRYPKAPNYTLRRTVGAIVLCSVIGLLLGLCFKLGADRQCNWMKSHGTEYQITHYCGGTK